MNRLRLLGVALVSSLSVAALGIGCSDSSKASSTQPPCFDPDQYWGCECDGVALTNGMYLSDCSGEGQACNAQGGIVDDAGNPSDAGGSPDCRCVSMTIDYPCG